MGEVEQLEQKVQSLSEKELTQFRAWFAEFDAAAWDSKFNRDVNAGKLDDLAEKALREHVAGNTRRL